MIDTSFDMRSDPPRYSQPKGNMRDSDTFSPTLKQYHDQLKQQRIPCGRVPTPTLDGYAACILSDGLIDELSFASDSIITPHSATPAHFLHEVSRDEMRAFAASRFFESFNRNAQRLVAI